MQKYLEDYVEHFNLTSRLRLSTIVIGVHRDDEHDRWVVDVEGSGPEYFDKIIIASGINSRPHVPKLEGLEQFEGEVLHSRAFKKYVFTCLNIMIFSHLHVFRPELFKGKKVVVVGMGNTGADTAAALCGHADKVWVSHNHGALVVRIPTFAIHSDNIDQTHRCHAW